MEGIVEDIGNEVDVTETVDEVNKLLQWIYDSIPVVVNAAIMIVIALIIFFVGKKLIKLLIKIIDKSLQRSSIDEGVCKFLKSLISILLTIFLIIVIAGFLGFETTSMAAIVGSAGLAVGLSLQGSLANFAGGVLILVLKPFVMGDYIIANGYEGNVVGIDIFYSKLRTADNKSIVIPNGDLSNSVIVNVTRQPDRRMDLVIGIDYSQNINDVKNVLLGIAENSEYVLQDKAVDIFVDDFDASSVNIGYRVWVKTEEYWPARWSLLEKIKEEFDKEGIAIPFNQLDVNIKNDASE